MKRHLHLFVAYLRVSVMNEIQYRANLFIQLFQSLLSLITGLVALALVFSYTDSVAGWGPHELLALMGVHLLVGGLIAMTIRPNMERLMDDVQEGTLDYALTKPADTQWLISVREVRIWRTVDVTTGLIVLGVAMWQLHETIGIGQVLAFAIALLLGGLIVYSVWLMLATASFWFVRLWNVLDIFDSLYQTGRWPLDIYPDWLRLGVTFLVPVAFAVTVPTQALIDRLTLETLLTAVAVALLLLAVSRWVFRQGLQHYGGASA